MLSTSTVSRLQAPLRRVQLQFVSCHPCGIRSPHSTRLFCKCFHGQDSVDIDSYRQAFSRKMAMAGIQTHHRIALGVSGGPDSIALCVLASGWKTEDSNAVSKSSGFIDGLLAIIVDHGLRAESKYEACLVSQRVSDMGVRCEIACCDWSNGRPTRGHVQEAARDMRYQIFQNVCMQNQINVLLVAHHADDQAELFILRLSRNSGVLGLAGMAFVSQMFPSTCSSGINSKNHSILLVRPLLDFAKEDMYKICKGGNQFWVEDPTNKSQLYARNRIRLALEDSSSSAFKSEMQAVISMCRKARIYVYQICRDLINQTVTVLDQGYAVVDLELLDPLNTKEICLSKFLALVLQFISQRQRPLRGSASKLLLEYIRTFPCKTSFSAAGCYLCPAPGSKGTKILVCCSTNGPVPLEMEVFHTQPAEPETQHGEPELEQIILNGILCSKDLIPESSDVNLLEIPSQSVVSEAKSLGLISESTYSTILSLQKEETGLFKRKTGLEADYNPKNSIPSSSVKIQPGQTCYFMSRFLVTWKQANKGVGDDFPGEAYSEKNLNEQIKKCSSTPCAFTNGMVGELRNMIESDWLYLAKVSKYPYLDYAERECDLSSSESDRVTEKMKQLRCLHYARFSAKRALELLKSIPVAARRSLPVLVDSQGLLLSIPNIGFRQCSCVIVSAAFVPRVPLGGGHTCFI